ncbi:hypothetical protein BVY01_02460 [bacterium I07]|nr:hypothetical protein BVY01_02460 [bacterium I07]
MSYRKVSVYIILWFVLRKILLIIVALLNLSILLIERELNMAGCRHDLFDDQYSNADEILMVYKD